MIRKSIILSAVLAASFLSSCKDDNATEDPIETEEITFTKEGEATLIKASSGDTIQQIDIEIADNSYERETGLMYRESMEDDQGMLFIYDNEAPRAFYMKNTYIALDIIYFASDSTAVSFQKNAQPQDETSLPSEAPAQFILEINAGLADDWNIEVGDKIDFQRVD
ncbi:DUF192 domain-containing protein [Salegentibacter salarius]|uniref:DUF192 domain-containing protein n=1 Tax=Salegentibacter salarius TaxID=435906 RepID=A0A2N0U0Q6_9FLAO|nr:DUF192 domain-containing protein [Salegentibacter salarius]OEY73554.1 hypothetical protein BHS39_08850 [Salegentibacter salarius]PKD20590.1 hypothetical protein APR40_08845 [Salegentibacter salarius]SLJ95868.1 hypothetical protein SAMN05660445_01802 [Salegentibacter salarius]